MGDSVKRSATSPLQAEEKKLRHSSEGSDYDYDPDATILNSDFLSSTRMDGNGVDGATGDVVLDPAAASFSKLLKDALPAALCDPAVVGAIASAVMLQLKNEVSSLKEEVVLLQRQIVARDETIGKLESRLDDMEQYQRRNNIRITGIPEESGESTDKIVIELAKAIGCDVESYCIDRSHRLGPKNVSSSPRPILAKFVSYATKSLLMRSRRNLRDKSGPDVLPSLNWLPERRGGPGGGGGGGEGRGIKNKVFLNDDLTSARAKIAAEARGKKKSKAIEDTWVRDGVVFVKSNDTIHRILTMRQLNALA